jgi:peptidoglycan/LPS O-acetylase OafA/YrhL
MGYLRTLLAIIVIFDHTAFGPILLGGRFAVQTFYLISGFLIAHILRTNPTYASARPFYLNRVLRIYPIYWVIALLTVIADLAFNPQFFELFTQIPDAAKALLILSNTIIFGQDWVMFSKVANGSLAMAVDFRQSEAQLWHGLLIPQAWTLGVELSFYLIAPFVLRRPSLTIGLFVASVLIRVTLIRSGLSTDPWNYRFFPSELSLFLAGALSNRFLLPRFEQLTRLSSDQSRPLLCGAVRRCAALCGMLYLIALCLFYRILPIPNSLKSGVYFISVILIMPLAFLYSSKLDKRVGELSYPVYLGHVLVILLVGKAVKGFHLVIGDFAEAMLCVGMACAFAVLLNHVVARAIDPWRTAVRSSAGAPMAVQA